MSTPHPAEPHDFENGPAGRAHPAPSARPADDPSPPYEGSYRHEGSYESRCEGLYEDPVHPPEAAERARARHIARASCAASRAAAYGGVQARDGAGRTAADAAGETAGSTTAGRAALLALDTAQLALGTAVNNTSDRRDVFAATARGAALAAQDAVDCDPGGLHLVANILADGYEALAGEALSSRPAPPPTPEEEAAIHRGEGEPYDDVYVHPEDSAAYTERTRVRQPKDGRSYRPRPFLLSEDARRVSPTGELFAPGVGRHWRIAWRPLFP
ncbi:hypothetical protein [Streptomyces sp. NPDC059398]|uniref:hypothetical protein n=1 Tax=Streptomyces sp. NPDC059398 TaxID=3346820 RepID=UPI0036CE2870